MTRAWVFLAFLVLLGSGASAANAFAQAVPVPTGYVSAFGDYFPNQQDTTELRARLFVEEKIEASPRIRLTLSGFAEGLLGRRPLRVDPLVPARPGGETAGIVRVHDANIEIAGKRLDLLAGYARVTWGKLDEIQPTDVVNPLDISRFFFEGRSEARVPVLLVRGRVHVSETLSIDALYVPDFRSGRFDRLAESSSPFNIVASIADGLVSCAAIGCPIVPPVVVDRQPSFTLRNAQGGARLSATSGRVDWSVSGYRGFEPFALYGLSASGILQEHPRFTMIGADFESVQGRWGVRGEAAAFVRDSFQSSDLRIVQGTSFDAGVGVDRRAGDYTVSGTVLVHSESYDGPVLSKGEGPLAATDSRDGRTDVSLIASADRTFARERYRLRTFGVYNATESSGFARVIGIANVRDNVAIEASIGWFAGGGRDLVGRFNDSDFGYVRLKYYF